MGNYIFVILLTGIPFIAMILLLAAKPKFAGKMTGSFIVIAAVGGLLILALLTYAERGNPDASIQCFADAFWYSIVTLSTVGYGDLYPVTAVGRILGFLFVLMSVGLLTFLISSVISVLTGRMLPALRLRFLRNKPWFVFSEMNEAVLALAWDLAKQEPEGIFLFPESQRSCAPSGLNCGFYPGSMEQVVRGKKENCVLFLMDEESGANYERALAVLKLGHPVYCRTEQAPDRCPEGLTLFNRYDCCAQEYWRSMGLSK